MKQKTFLLLSVTVLLSAMFTVSANQKSDFASKGIPQSLKASSIGSSVPLATEWSKKYGANTHVYSVVQTDDGGYAIAGFTTAFGVGGMDFWLGKTDVAGNMQWNKTYGGTESELAHSVLQTSDGGYVIAGYAESFGVGQFDFWLVKTDSSGNHQWNRTYGGTNTEFASSVVETSDGGYAIAGETRSFPANVANAWLVKTDANGNVEWSKVYGGTGYDRVSSVRQTTEGGYIMSGITESFATGAWDFWLVKTDATGNMQWNKTYGGADYDGASSLVQTSNGGYALAGYTKSFGAGEGDIYLVKTNATGGIEWSKTYGGANGDEAKYVRQTDDEGYIIAGSTRSFGLGSSDFWLVKTDSSGNMEWNKTFGGPNQDAAFSVLQTCDGGYALAGYTEDIHLVVWAWLVKIASDQPTDTIYIRADGSFDPPTAPISTVDNVTYTLTGNITCGSFGVVVERDNVVVDGVGYTVQGTESGIGIYLSYSSNVTIKNLKIKAFYYGLYLWHSSNNTITGNNITENIVYGLYVRNSFGNSISANNITANDDYGVWLDNSSSNTILGNTVAKNPIGIWADRSSSNMFYHNNFINNTNQVHVTGDYPNTWDDGYTSGGNYWSDYTGEDMYSGPHQNETCSDGIGDSAYTIDNNNRDHYPIIDSWSIHLNPPVARFTYSPTVPSVGKEIAFDASSCYDLDKDVVAYRWDFDDGNITSTVDPIIVHTYEFPGEFNVTLTVIDSKGSNCCYAQTVWVRMPTSFSISTSCASTPVGFTVNVAGTLSDIHGNGVKDETVFLYYTFGGTAIWSLITSETTDSLGHYFAMWIPPTIGNFEVKTEWAGNSTHFGTSNVTILNMGARVSISLSSSTSYVGFKIEISGNFTCNGIGYPEAPILLSYSVTGGESWNDITLANTSSNGSYFAIWMPPATGNHLVKAAWAGNPAYPGATTTVNFAVIPFEEQNVFSVTSNSTISELDFESTSRELRFKVSGPSGAKGYVDLYIAKTLIENIQDVEVKLNGEEINYTATSLDDSWLLHFTYLHSTHEVTVVLGQVVTPFIGDLFWVFALFGLVIVAIAILVGLYVLKRRQRSRMLTEFSEMRAHNVLFRCNVQ
jgi:parallel beta-helix repeat protein